MNIISRISKNIQIVTVMTFLYVVLPVQNVFAAGEAETPSTAGSNATPAVRLQNPLAGTIDSLPALVKSLLNIVMIIGTPIVALAIIYAGFMLVAAQGNPEKLQKARQALLWAIVGGAILLGSYVLAQAIGGTVDQLTTG